MYTINPWSKRILQKKSIEEIQIMTTAEEITGSFQEFHGPRQYILHVTITWFIMKGSFWRGYILLTIWIFSRRNKHVDNSWGCDAWSSRKCWHSFFFFFKWGVEIFYIIIFFLNNIKCHQGLWQLAESCTKEKLHNGEGSSGWWRSNPKWVPWEACHTVTTWLISSTCSISSLYIRVD